MHPGIQRQAEALAWTRSPTMKALPIRYVAAIYLQIREREGHRDVEGHPVIHASVAKKPH